MKTNTEYSYFLWWYKKLKAIKLLGGKCRKCGENRPWLLNFHHKNPKEKEFHIKKIRRMRWSFLVKEIEKCELLCYNCHKEEHHSKETIYLIKKHKLLEIKNIFNCQYCGYNNYVGALDFHHEKDKNILLTSSSLTSLNQIKDEIIEEIKKCKVLCANCHQDLHFDKEKFHKIKKEIKNHKYKENPSLININIVYDLFVNKKMKIIDIAKKLHRASASICDIIKRNNWRKF